MAATNGHLPRFAGRTGGLLLALALAACERDAPRPVRAPREAVRQLLRCTLDNLGEEPSAARVEGAMRFELRRDRERFAARAGTCETALETEGGRHACVARLRERWARMLTVVQRPAADAIDQDVAIRRIGEAFLEASRSCPE
ncbi:MAG: hypothetical protein U0326_15085 [Polyangiales bacterium]